MAVRETKAPGTMQYVVDAQLSVLAGHGGAGREHGGVGFVFDGQARQCITGFETVPGGRIMAVGLDLAPRRLTMLSAYAPHNGHPEGERHAFYEELGAVIGKASRKGPVLVLGDLNARLHGRLLGEQAVLEPVLFGRGAAFLRQPDRLLRGRPNRELLMDMCVEHGLLANSWFQKPVVCRVTFHEPGVERLPPLAAVWDPVVFAQLDLCLIQSRWRGLVEDVESQPFSELPSDHFPLLVKVRARCGARPGRGGGKAQSPLGLQVCHGRPDSRAGCCSRKGRGAGPWRPRWLNTCRRRGRASGARGSGKVRLSLSSAGERLRRSAS